MKISKTILLIGAIAISSTTLAFKQGIHEDITDTVLESIGFDTWSTDEVSDSNWYTDIFEPRNEAAHADGNKLDEASARLKEKRSKIITSLQSGSRRGALDRLGEALHTVQDIVSHSNTIDNNFPISKEMLFGLSRGTAECDSENNFAPDGLVSGYFSLSGLIEGGILGSIPVTERMAGNQCSGMPGDMCCHLDLNKDNDEQLNGANHLKAKDDATRLTIAFVESLFSEMDREFGEEAEYYKAWLMGKESRTYFVVDDTGSMGTDISGVRSSVYGLINRGISVGLSQSLGLVTFKDTATDYGFTNDVTAFKARIDSIYPSGGGDCPEGSGVALHKALDNFTSRKGDLYSTGGTVTLFTDADPRNPALLATAKSRATAMGVQITTVVTGSCGKTYSASTSKDGKNTSIDIPEYSKGDVVSSSATSYDLYRELSTATGGISFRVNRAEIADILPVYLNITDINSAPLLNEVIELATGTPIVKHITVDGTMSDSKLTFVLSMGIEGIFPELEIRTPSGADVVEGDGVTFIEVSGVKSVVINQAEVGGYILTLTGGAGNIAARAYAESSLAISDVKMFRKPEIAVRHVDWVPINGKPSVGESVMLKLTLSDKAENVTLKVLSEKGDVLLSPELELSGITGRKFTTEFEVPSESFRLVVNGGGLDVASSGFVRELPYSISPVPLTVNVSPEWAEIAPSEKRTFTVEVTNSSSEEKQYQLFSDVIFDGAFSDVELFTLASGETKLVSVEFTLSDTAPLGESSELIFEVRNVTDQSVYNTAISRVIIKENEPPQALDDTLNVNVGAEPSPLHVMYNDRDPNGDILFVSGIDETSTLGGSVALTDNIYYYTPKSGTFGDDSLTYTVTDGRGGYATATVSIFINRNPVALSNTAFFERGQAGNSLVDVLYNATDEDGHSLSMKSIDDVDGDGVTFEIVEDNKIKITVDETADTDVTTTFEIEDGFGGTAKAEFTVKFNSAPQTLDYSVQTIEQTPVSINVLDKATDADGDALTAEVLSDTSKYGGSITIADGVITYVAKASYGGLDSFEYRVIDAHGVSATGLVAVKVDMKKTPPKKSGGSTGYGIIILLFIAASRRYFK